MRKAKKRPKIDVAIFHDGNVTIYEAYGKVYAQKFREKLSKDKSAPLPAKQKITKLKSS
jgi:hypothetical protein